MSLLAEHITLGNEDGVRLSEVSCEIRPGEITVIIGPNGSGKTSLIKVLSGELLPSNGQVSLDNTDLCSWPPVALARRRAVMPQHARLDFPFRVRDVVALGRSPFPRDVEKDRRLVAEAMACFDIRQLADRMYTTLSGGERQRVHLARVWVQLSDFKPDEPSYLLLDEPVSALDIKHQRELMGLLRDTVATGNMGVGVVLHDLGSAARHADRMILMQDGRVLAQGERDRVLTVENLEQAYQVPVNFIRYTQGSAYVLAIPRGDSGS